MNQFNFDAPQHAFRIIQNALRTNKGILIAGPPNSGKTTFLSDLVVQSDLHDVRCTLTGEIRLEADVRRIVELSASCLPISACIHASSPEDAWDLLSVLGEIGIDEAKAIFPVIVQMSRDALTKAYTIKDVFEA